MEGASFLGNLGRLREVYGLCCGCPGCTPIQSVSCVQLTASLEPVRSLEGYSCRPGQGQDFHRLDRSPVAKGFPESLRDAAKKRLVHARALQSGFRA